MKLSAPSTPQLEHEDAELVRREHERRIVELQQLPAVGLTAIQNVLLVDGKETPIPHRLARAVLVLVSPPRNAVSTGRIEEIRGAQDPKKYVVLKATGWGATITVDLVVL